MAEETVGFLIERIADVMAGEVHFLLEVKDELGSLQSELEMMHSFLIEADAKQEAGDERLRTCVRQIREIAYEAEDLIDSFSEDQEGEESADRKRLSSKGTFLRVIIRRITFIWTCLVQTHKTGNEIQALKTRIGDAIQRLQAYQVRSDYVHVAPKKRPTSYPHSIGDQHVVGIQDDVKKLVHLLVNSTAQENPRIPVTTVAIVGMGGAGKTTLARKLYNNEMVIRHFTCRAWVCVSQEWDAHQLLLEILLQASGYRHLNNQGDQSTQGLLNQLHEFLSHNTYLIVLDDVWKKEALQDLMPAFSHGNSSSSKVIITSRIEKTIQFPGFCYYMHKPKHLTKQESWALFCKIIVQVHNNHNDLLITSSETIFKDMGKDMVAKCGGLPLAVVALAGLLSTKDTIEEWERVKKVVSSMIMEADGSLGYGRVKDMLALSYHDLPYYLKSCYLYLGLFPEDYMFSAGMVSRMWVAEGFFNSNDSLSDDLAKECLEELAQRCMIQVEQISYANKVKNFRIHDLMRDLCIEKGKEQQFFEVFPSPAHLHQSCLGSQVNKVQPPRVTIYSRDSFRGSCSHVRSLIEIGEDKGSRMKWRPPVSLEPLLNFNRLRVLYIWGIRSTNDDLPREIGRLIHLRYLKIEDTNVKSIPCSLGNLRNLSTLDLRDNYYLKTLPDVLMKLEKLRHLYIRLTRSDDCTPFEFRCLNNLHTLEVEQPKGWMVNEVIRLSSSVQKLKFITDNNSPQSLVEAILHCPSIVLGNIRSLCIKPIETMISDPEPEHLDLAHCHNLRKMRLYASLGKASPLHFPPNLVALTLYCARLTQDSLKSLERLSCLQVLNLLGESYVDTQLKCYTSTFQQLRVLKVGHMDNVEEWIIEQGAMKCLKSLSINCCSKLQRIPEGLKLITTLQHLNITDMEEAFYRRLKRVTPSREQEDDDDFHIIQHIPFIHIPQNKHPFTSYKHG